MYSVTFQLSINCIYMYKHLQSIHHWLSRFVIHKEQRNFKIYKFFPSNVSVSRQIFNLDKIQCARVTKWCFALNGHRGFTYIYSLVTDSICLGRAGYETSELGRKKLTIVESSSLTRYNALTFEWGRGIWEARGPERWIKIARRVNAEYSALNHAAWHAGLHRAYNRIEYRILDFMEIETIFNLWVTIIRY